ncbi:hypothetical protein JZ751_022030 [Albula glossodonta]|uniref:Chemokine interleukin-8-like domain-containing protein n=1 Tax=Albula glossodonta TaxID=121402 RepID=A0A8T2NIA1_9TELE|nr:hypothetical protein JZ751_022030 [Albula glossodonta]
MQSSQKLSIFAFIAVIALFVEAGTAEGKFDSCCKEVSKVEITEPITGYELQHRNLPCVKAVIFVTADKKFCSQWNLPWVRRKIMQFNRSTHKFMASTTTSVPMVSTETTASTNGITAFSQSFDGAYQSTDRTSYSTDSPDQSAHILQP